MINPNFEPMLTDLFDTAIDVNDTIWYNDFETLLDAIMRVYENLHR